MPDDTPEHIKRDAGRSLAAEEWAIHTLMSDYNGRRYLADMLDRLNPLRARYMMDGDVTGAMWRDGYASAGTEILDQINRHAPSQYQQLIRERRTRIEKSQENMARENKSGDPEISSGETMAEDIASRQERAYKVSHELGKPSAEGTKSGS